VAEPNATRAGRQAGSVLASGCDARRSALEGLERSTNVGSVSCEAVSGGAVEWRAGPSLERGALRVTRGFDGREPDGVLGPALERHALFPQRANIGVAAVRNRESIRLQVWERGAGITRACGSGACAALVAAHRRGLTGRHSAVELDGGMLDIAWREDGHVIMTGPVALSFEGAFDSKLIAGG